MIPERCSFLLILQNHEHQIVNVVEGYCHGEGYNRYVATIEAVDSHYSSHWWWWSTMLLWWQSLRNHRAAH